VKYMLLIYQAENAIPDDKLQGCYDESAELARQLFAQGKLYSANPLKPPATATSIRPEGGKRIVTDGPFAETRETLAGYYMIEAADLDEAVAVGKRIPGGAFGTVEIRPVHPLEDLPTE
jgi:hypothetical protein